MKENLSSPSSLKAQIEKLCQGAVNVYSKEQLLKKLESKSRLKIKLGADPTAPDLHLGHAVILDHLANFQKFGHEVIFIIGDFTAMIGDPTGKSKTRPTLSSDQIRKNAETYFEQAFKILDKSKTQVVFNSQWLSKLNFSDAIKLTAKTTLAQIIEREDFAKRIKLQAPISLHELLYPLLQGYDSVELEADVELGGTDQTFNLLFGRHLQEQMEQEPQVVMTFPLLEGTDGVEKMSKSLGNYIGLSEGCEDAYGKLMSISDQMVWRYQEILLHKDAEEIKATKQKVEVGQLHPMDLKKQNAFAIVEKFWSLSEAKTGQAFFEKTFQEKDYTLVQEVSVISELESPCWIVTLLKKAKAVTSSSEAKRLIESGSVKIDDKKISGFQEEVCLTHNSILKVGKKKIYKLI